MRMKSLVQDAQETRLAIEMIELGARMQMLESETGLSRERLLKLYKEIRGESPPKGMLPFSTDWFITWQPNIHSSIFMNTYRYLNEHAGLSGIEAVLKAYQLYLEQVQPRSDEEPVLSLTRAWTLVRFFESKMLSMTKCGKCGGHQQTVQWIQRHVVGLSVASRPRAACSRAVASGRSSLIRSLSGPSI